MNEQHGQHGQHQHGESMSGITGSNLGVTESGLAPMRLLDEGMRVCAGCEEVLVLEGYCKGCARLNAELELYWMAGRPTQPRIDRGIFEAPAAVCALESVETWGRLFRLVLIAALGWALVAGCVELVLCGPQLLVR